MFLMRRNAWMHFLLAFVVIVFYWMYVMGLIQGSLITFGHRVYPNYRDILECYEKHTDNSLIELSNIVRINNSVFFIESTCPHEGIQLDPRQACSIESAALQNPNLDIYILFLSPITHGWKSNIYTREILRYTNVKLRHINMSNFFENTPLQKKWKQNRAGLRTSLYQESHATDILRYTLLWKYGGYYIDLDVILFRPFDKMMNFAGADSTTTVSAGLLSMTQNGLVADMCMNEIAFNFNRTDLFNNGPGVITRVMKTLCHKDTVQEMHGASCKGFSILKPHSLYPVSRQDWHLYYVPENAASVMAKLNGSLGVHVWNRYSKDTPVIKGSDQPYSLLARKFCPKVYSIIPDNSF